MRREDRVTVQSPVKKQQPDGMSHRGALYIEGMMIGMCVWGHLRGPTPESPIRGGGWETGLEPPRSCSGSRA